MSDQDNSTQIDPQDESPIEAGSEKEPAADEPAAVTDEAPPSTDEAATDAPAPTPTAEEAEEPKVEPATPAAPASDGHWWWGTGRRKAAVARVRIRPGNGKFVVNQKPYDQYFTEDRDRTDLINVLSKTGTAGGVDVYVNVRGGGFTGQAGAIILGLGRALQRFDPGLDSVLRTNGFLTRDPRRVERKKYGQPGARKRFQFSKR